MYKGKTIAVVIPAYNEERLIAQTIESVPDYVDRIVVVDDASADRTRDIVRETGRKKTGLHLIAHSVNGGVGAAIASGYLWCRDHEMDIAVVMAGDGQMNPDDMPALLDPVVENRVDYAKGNRLITGEAWQRIPRVRYLGNAAMSFLTKIASGYWHVADSQCGYTAINRRALKLIDWRQMYKRYGQPNDLLVRLNILNLRVCDVMVEPIYGIGEQSGIKPFRMIPRLSKLLLRLFLYRMLNKYVIRDTHPLVLFYALGGILTVPGVLLGLFLVFWRLVQGPDTVAMTSALFAVFLSVMGTQSLLFAMLFDMEANRDLKG